MDNSYDLTPKMNMVRFIGNLIELEGRIMKIRTLFESASRYLTVLVIVRAVTLTSRKTNSVRIFSERLAQWLES